MKDEQSAESAQPALFVLIPRDELRTLIYVVETIRHGLLRYYSEELYAESSYQDGRSGEA